MIGPSLASIVVNPFNYMRWLRETLGPYSCVLEATIISKRDEKRCRVMDKRLREPECAS
jgi:hypothetical protein